MKLHDLLVDLEAWLDQKIHEYTHLNNLTSSSYLNAYKTVKEQIEELKDEHE